MIIIEFLWKTVKALARLVFWLITARDCRHCKYSKEAYCDLECHHDKNTRYGKNRCRSTIWRCDFKRKRGENND